MHDLQKRLERVAKLAATPMDYDGGPNESRADWGEAGVLVADPDFGSNEVYISAKDVVANICHAFERMGLEPSEVLDAGLRSYEQDRVIEEIGGGKPAQRNLERYPDIDALPVV